MKNNRGKKRNCIDRTPILLALAASVFTVLAVAGYVYSQNASTIDPMMGGAHSQSQQSGMQQQSMPLSSAECDQMMKSLNVSQGAINSMDQMMQMMGSMNQMMNQNQTQSSMQEMMGTT